MIRRFILILLLFLTWVTCVYHMGTAPRVGLDTNFDKGAKAQWIPKEKFGIHQLILEGTPKDRGMKAGALTYELLYLQEKALQSELKYVLPNRTLQKALFFLSMRWFWGIENYLEKWMLEEMWGVSQSASHDFDFLADGYTRQIAYHGLHEVGQTMVDMNPAMMGCTVLAVPGATGWIVGRNFDFEGGEVFDEHKIMKWVFPETGSPFLSVIWAGMVGAVTGVNANGVFISINAAGTKDFRRVGTPSTLVALKALQFSKTAEEAKEIIEKSDMFITDIFVVSQSHRKILYRIEKTPKRFVTHVEENPVAITNHLISNEFKDDAINAFRRDKMTSMYRFERGQELVNRYSSMRSNRRPVEYILDSLRDKNLKGGIPLPIGNRMAIDSLIATHAVVFDGDNDTLFVSQGPTLVGPFTGFDLKKSFETHTPVVVETLPKDPKVSMELRNKISQERKLLKEAKLAFKSKNWAGAKPVLDQAILAYDQDSDTYKMLGDFFKTSGDKTRAKEAYAKALELKPAYIHEKNALERELKQ